MYSGKRRGRFGRKRMLRKRKHILRDIDHSGKGMQFAKAIAKGVSKKRYDSCTSVRTQWVSDPSAGNPFALNNTIMVPFHQLLQISSQTNAFIPYDLLMNNGVNDQQFARHANMYVQYRVKCIRFEFVPSNAVTGAETQMPISFGPYGVRADAVAGIMDGNQSAGSRVWLIKWPNKGTGTFQDFGVNFDTSTINHYYNTSALADPSVIKIPFVEKLVLTWKPKILGYRNTTWRPLTVGGNDKAQQTFYPVAKKFPWTNIIDNFDYSLVAPSGEQVGMRPTDGATGVTGPYNTTGLRCPMSFPLIAMYDYTNNAFVDAATFAGCGRWTMHAVFEFRQKRDKYAGQINQVAENIPEIVFGAGISATV